MFSTALSSTILIESATNSVDTSSEAERTTTAIATAELNTNKLFTPIIADLAENNIVKSAMTTELLLQNASHSFNPF
jgi:hypothetical protein